MQKRIHIFNYSLSDLDTHHFYRRCLSYPIKKKNQK